MKREVVLHCVCVSLSLLTVFLLFAGAMVTSTGSGLAVPDWPLSYGQFFPPMVGGVFYEHGHRIVAGLVATLTTFTTILAIRWESRTWVKQLAVLAWVSVITQALLGGLTVLYKLPLVVSATHATLAELFFCMTIVLSIVTSRWWASVQGDWDLRGVEGLAFCLPLLFLAQLILGALMRHSGAGLAIPDFPTVFGGLIPPSWNFRVVIHFAHRVGALVIVLCSLFLAVRVLKGAGTSLAITMVAGLIVAAVFFQALLGGAVVVARRPPLLTSFHLVLGAICFGLSVALATVVVRLRSKSPRVQRYARLTIQEVT